jgi:4-amino-4-deoxy-L-arabinose transferase-like glycosyltransferase
VSSRIRTWLPAISIVYLLYFFRITGVGIQGPDEPRYAAIGREMARSGDWITPRLWGEPWFEKPALLYWMVGLGQRLGLGDDLSPRLPVALLSAGFLLFLFLWLRRLFDGQTAFIATAMLGTSAFWIAFSQVGTTDLPLAVWFSVAAVLCAGWLKDGDGRVLPFAGIALGLAVLAKGLVPLVLAAPLAWSARKRWKGLLLMGGFALGAALPWYLAMTLRFGRTFLDDFFLRHHFQRFASDALQHAQPWWFYIPVLLGALFPWTPVLALIRDHKILEDGAVRFLGLTVAFGFVFFSAATNKLPGYLLPLLPSLCVIAAVALRRAGRARLALAVSGLLLGLLPVIAPVLPLALAKGISQARLETINWPLCILFAATGIAAWRLSSLRAAALIAAAVCAGIVYLKVATYPAIDALVSARSVWREVAPDAGDACVASANRGWRYGLNYYSVQPLPDCEGTGRTVRIRQEPGRPAVIERGTTTPISYPSTSSDDR